MEQRPPAAPRVLALMLVLYGFWSRPLFDAGLAAVTGTFRMGAGSTDRRASKFICVSNYPPPGTEFRRPLRHHPGSIRAPGPGHP